MTKEASTSYVSPDDQSVTFVELFFDLVFVFSVTQIVGLIHGHISLESIGQSILVFWLVWWAWTQFTWALNAANTNHATIRMATLLATGIAFFMAVTLPGVFEGGALWFAIPYVLVRIVGLKIYRLAASSDPGQRSALNTFSLFSVGGMVAVLIGGYLQGDMIYWFWTLAILLDILAANRGAKADGWNLHPEHFGERHGLFVIIALGETLIVAGSSVSGTELDIYTLCAALMAVAVTCILWWSYFTRLKPLVDHSLEKQTGAAQSMMSRDVYSLYHFPMLCGVIAIAVVFEEVVGHPETSLAVEGRFALGSGVLLFLTGMAMSFKRATGQWLSFRILVSVITGLVVILISNVSPLISLGIAFTGITLVCIYEQSALKEAKVSTFNCVS